MSMVVIISLVSTCPVAAKFDAEKLERILGRARTDKRDTTNKKSYFAKLSFFSRESNSRIANAHLVS